VWGQNEGEELSGIPRIFLSPTLPNVFGLELESEKRGFSQKLSDYSSQTKKGQ